VTAAEPAAAALPTLLDYAALSAYLQVPTGTLRYWASKDGWTAYGTPRARLWPLSEAVASFTDRRMSDLGEGPE
jgi:hypothetical protein